MMFQRRRRGTTDEDDARPNLSRMLDCVLVLLILFTLTMAFTEGTRVQVNHRERSVPGAQEKNILIAVTAEDKVIYGKREIGLKGVQAVVKPVVTENKDITCIIQGDELAKLGTVTRVQDECLLAGVKREKLTITSN